MELADDLASGIADLWNRQRIKYLEEQLGIVKLKRW